MGREKGKRGRPKTSRKKEGERGRRRRSIASCHVSTGCRSLFRNSKKRGEEEEEEEEWNSEDDRSSIFSWPRNYDHPPLLSFFRFLLEISPIFSLPSPPLSRVFAFRNTASSPSFPGQSSSQGNEIAIDECTSVKIKSSIRGAALSSPIAHSDRL